MHLNPNAAFQQLVTKYLRPLAQRERFECLIREALISDEFLYKLFYLRKDLFAVFEKVERTDYSSMPLSHMHNLLTDMRYGFENEAKLSKLLQEIQSGYINGRSIHASSIIRRADNGMGVVGNTLEEVYLFPEFIEGICRAAYLFNKDAVAQDGLVKLFLSGLERAINTLKAPPPEAKLSNKRGARN